MEISAAHRRRLDWFEERRGEVLPLSAVTADGMRLITLPKGIYKPQDLKYALSIRIVHDSNYADGGVVQRPEGGWALKYHQENSNADDRDKEYTNRGLMACIEDGVPVGVLREVGRNGRQRQYEVLGLAKPVSWDDGFFHFESMPEGLPLDAKRLIARAQAELDEHSVADIPDNDEDARDRVAREVVARRGQSAFRAVLIDAYRGRCAITGCNALPVLEAAHLRPYRGPAWNVVTNGLLLRADIHSLLDQQLLAPEPDSRTIWISSQLMGTPYEELSGRPLADPAAPSQRPAANVLQKVWQNFQLAEKAE
jgi:putative restriction endonuclease